MIPERERLPRRDWIILPLLCLISLVLVLSASEVAARVFWPEQLSDRCAVPDPQTGLRFTPDCRSTVKSAEGPWLENAYNACGLRTAEPCAPLPADGFRVAVIGSSISSGYLVPYAQTFAAKATAMLQTRCRIPVDFQNLATPGIGIDKTPSRLDAALALHPGILLMALSTHDLEVLPVDGNAGSSPAGGASGSPAHGGLSELMRQAVVRLRASRATLVAQHFLYENLDSYLPLYLQHGDEADYLRRPLSSAWQRRLDRFEQEVDEIASRARARNVPFMLMFVPLRAQALLLNWKHLPPDIDPTLLGQALGEIAQRHGVAYLDLTRTIGGRDDVISLYYPVDSHPDAAAGTVIADALTADLLAHVASLAGCSTAKVTRN